MGLEIDEVQDLAENIASLEPNPGRAFLPDSDAMVVVPEVLRPYMLGLDVIEPV